MPIKIYFKHTPLTDFSIRLQSGIRSLGDEVVNTPEEADVGCAWGIINANRLRASGMQNVLVMERAYLNDRESWLSLGWNGLNGYATFNNSYVPSDRWRKYWQHGLKNWVKPNSNRVLLCGQVLTDQSLADCEDYNLWLNETIMYLNSKGYEVVFRPHPLEKIYVITSPCILSKEKDFYNDLKMCKCVVTWSSTVATQAVYNGIPTVTFSKGSMAYDVSSHSLDQLDYTCDRTLWGIRLAYTMWNIDELSSGVAWDFVRTHILVQ
jgi:hypothetical protein